MWSHREHAQNTVCIFEGSLEFNVPVVWLAKPNFQVAHAAWQKANKPKTSWLRIQSAPSFVPIKHKRQSSSKQLKATQEVD